MNPTVIRSLGGALPEVAEDDIRNDRRHRDGAGNRPFQEVFDG